jgi:GNAT superfamily N-acetyltransferase
LGAAVDGYRDGAAPLFTVNENSQIRGAGPDDAAFLARVILLSARSHLEDRPGFWEKALNGTEAECCAYLEQLALAEPRCPSHWGHFLVAEVNGRAAAALAGYDPRNVGGRFGSEAMRKADIKLGRGNTMGTAAYRHALQTLEKCAWREQGELDPGAWIIEYVATLSEFRGGGLMKALLSKTLERGRAQGCTFARVHVFIGNTPAESVYTKAGFMEAGVRRDRNFEDSFGAPGMKLLLKRPL